MRITQHNLVASVAAVHRGAVAPLLTRMVRRFLPEGATGCRVAEQAVQHFVIDAGTILFPAGLVPRVVEALERAGHSVDVDDQSQWPHLERACAWSNAMAFSKDLWGAITTNPRGQILVTGYGEQLEALEAFAHAFPAANILVVVATRDEVEQLTRELGRRLQRRVTSGLREALHNRPRMLVTTAQLWSMSGSEDFDLLVFADRASAWRARGTIIQDFWPHAVAYAILSQALSAQESELFQLEAAFGPVIYSTSSLNSPAIEVRFRRVLSPRLLPAGQRGLQRRRQAFWHNDDWNGAVCDAVTDTCDRSGSLVGVLVDSVEHGRVLQERLPKSRLLSARMDDVSAIWHTVPLVVTASFADRHGLNVDVLVRADGGAEWPCRKWPLTSGSVARIIDFADNRDARSSRATVSRFKLYETLNCRIIGPAY